MMKKKNIIKGSLFVFLAFFIAPFVVQAVTSLTMEVKTGSRVDEAKTVIEDVKEDEFVVVPEFKDTNFLFTGKSMSSLVIYNIAESNVFLMVTGVGDSVVEIAAENIGRGDFVIINTTEPDGCTTLTLEECRNQSNFISEQSFSISPNERILEEIATPLASTTLSSVLEDEDDVSVVDYPEIATTTTPTVTVIPIIIEEEFDLSATTTATTTETTIATTTTEIIEQIPEPIIQ